MTQRKKSKAVAALLCVSSLILALGGWEWSHAGDNASTDDAYVGADVTAVAPKVGGYVTSLSVTDNQLVKVGDVLFRIDDRDYRARVAQSQANLQAAEASLANVDAQAALQQSLIEQAEAQRRAAAATMTNAVKTSNRQRELARTNVVSEATVDNTEAARTQAEAGVAAAEANLKAQKQRVAVLAAQRSAAAAAVAQANAALVLSRLDLEHTVVRSAIEGIVGDRHVRLGQLVAPGAPLLDLVPTDDVWLIANFKETQIGSIHPGERVRIMLDAYPRANIEGVVDSFAPGSGSAFSLLPADNATGNFVRVVQRVPVKIRLVGNPLPGRIVPGLSARVEVLHRTMRGIRPVGRPDAPPMQAPASPGKTRTGPEPEMSSFRLVDPVKGGS